jgi:hypothetical protein
MASLLHSRLANVWNLFFQISFKEETKEIFVGDPKMLLQLRSRQAYSEHSSWKNKQMFPTNEEAAASVKLVSMRAEQAGVRFVAISGGALFAIAVSRPILGPALSHPISIRNKAPAG